ncbi:MAG: hypothetical protein A2593_04920 [Candidatus Moranbacteria bacterium RIFOXYD1_FULL_44_9]|nr:MAG: hypothetical protein A2593_04920 [Candidatus Moranbacteria bacterium RIFOXYD1_FULL_44_9]
MRVNGANKILQGMSYAEIGKMLQEASPNKNGVGLNVELTEQEEAIFERDYGLAIGRTIGGLIADAVKEIGEDPRGFRYTYSNLLFITTANI